MKPSDKISASPQVVARQVGDETVILDLASGTYFGLDPVGARIWQLLADGKTIAQTCEVMVQEFDVSRTTLEQDTLDLVNELAAKKLVAIVSSA